MRNNNNNNNNNYDQYLFKYKKYQNKKRYYF
jgi:hypothetical protein